MLDATSTNENRVPALTECCIRHRHSSVPSLKSNSQFINAHIIFFHALPVSVSLLHRVLALHCVLHFLISHFFLNTPPRLRGHFHSFCPFSFCHRKLVPVLKTDEKFNYFSDSSILSLKECFYSYHLFDIRDYFFSARKKF